MRTVRDNALFEKAAILTIELQVGVWILGGCFVQMLEEAAGEDLVELLHQGAILHGFTRDIQRKILAIYHPTQKTQPLRKQSLGLGLDKNLLAVEIDLGLHAPQAHALQIHLGNEEQGLNGQRGIGSKMEAKQRRLMVVADELIKLVVFLVLNLIPTPGPQCLNCIEPLPIQLNRKGHERRVALDDGLNLRGFSEMTGFLLKVQGDLGSPLRASRRLQLIAACPLTRPSPGSLTGRMREGVDRDAIRHHERGIKSNPKLADQAGIRLLLLRHLLQKGFGT